MSIETFFQNLIADVEPAEKVAAAAVQESIQDAQIALGGAQQVLAAASPTLAAKVKPLVTTVENLMTEVETDASIVVQLTPAILTLTREVAPYFTIVVNAAIAAAV